MPIKSTIFGEGQGQAPAHALGTCSRTMRPKQRTCKEYALRLNRKSVGAPVPANPPKQTSILHTGDRKRPPKAYGIQEGLPDFPDSHSFIRTPTHKQPQADYESVREKAASQKRDVERALSRFIAKTCGKTHSLFTTDDTNLFPLISCADTTVHAEFNTNLGADSGGDLVQVPSYVNALLFRDQIFEEYEYKPKKPKKEDDRKKKKGQKRPIEDVKKDTSEPESDTEKDTSVNAGDAAAENSDHEDTKVKLEDQPSTNKTQINQFMRPARLPRSNVYSLPPK